MTVLVVVSITGTTADKIREVAAARPDLGADLEKLAKKHGMIAHRRYFSGDDILDLDEWETENGFKEFYAEARPVIETLAKLRGANIPTDRIWYRL